MTRKEAMASLDMMLDMAWENGFRNADIKVSVDNVNSNVHPEDLDSDENSAKYAGITLIKNPKQSPDIQKPVEHAIGFIKRRFKHKLLSSPQPLSAQAMQRLVEEVASDYPTASVQKDVFSLPLTYGVIATPRGEYYKAEDGSLHPGCGGGWPEARYR